MSSGSQLSSTPAKLAERYRLLTLAMVDSIGRDDIDGLTSLLNERSAVLTELEQSPNLGSVAVDLLRTAAAAESALMESLASAQAGNVNRLVKSFREQKVTMHYRKPDRSGRVSAVDRSS